MEPKPCNEHMIERRVNRQKDWNKLETGVSFQVSMRVLMSGLAWLQGGIGCDTHYLRLTVNSNKACCYLTKEKHMRQICGEKIETV